MSKNTIRLTRDDLVTIKDIFDKFPEVHSLEVTVDHGSGIGAAVTVALNTTINDYSGTFEIDITDISTW
jgi:hypothetical protein